MRILIACEFSGIVRDAFAARGHEAWSIDLLDCEKGVESGLHHTGNVLEHIPSGFGAKWDMMIAFPPCTHLAVSGARWFKGKQAEQRAAIDFVRALWCADIPKIALENPIGVLSAAIGKPTQIIQPWQFGHGETKATCLWLKGLPPLVPTRIVAGRTPRVHHESPGPERWKRRSRTLQGIADAMAEQWG